MSSSDQSHSPAVLGDGDIVAVGKQRGLVADRTLLALEVLGSTQGGLGVSELGRRLGVDKSTAHRLLATLLGRGFVRFSPSTQRYLLGFRLMTLGAAAARDIDLVEGARPIMEDLRNACGETVSLAILTDGDAMIVVGDWCHYSKFGCWKPDARSCKCAWKGSCGLASRTPATFEVCIG